MNLQERMGWLRTFVTLAHELPVTPSDYLKEREEWQAAVQALYAAREDQKIDFTGWALFAIEAFREMPYPWMDDIYSGMPPEELSRRVHRIVLRRQDYFVNELADSKWARCCIDAVLDGEASLVALSRKALHLGLKRHLHALVKETGPEMGRGRDIVRSLFAWGGSGNEMKMAQDLSSAGISRAFQVSAILYGGVLGHDTYRSVVTSSRRGQLLAITQAPAAEMPEIARILRADHEARGSFKSTVPAEVLSEILEMVEKRIALQQVPVHAMTMAAP